MRNKERVKLKDWRKVKLGEVVEIIDGDRGTNYPNGSDFSDSGFCLFLNTKNVTGSNFDFSECQFITQKKDEKLRKGKLQRGDFVLTTRGTVGNIVYYSDDIPYDNVRINSGMVILRPKKDVISEKFFHLFLISQNFKNQIEAIKSGSAQPQLPIRDLKLFEINLPPIDRQKNIAQTLFPINEKIEVNNKIIKTLEEMASTIFKEWFVKFRFPGHEKVKMIDSELGLSAEASVKAGKIPEGWRIGNLGDGFCSEIIKPGVERFEGEKIYLATADVVKNEIVNDKTKITYKNRPIRANSQPVLNSVWFAKMINTYKVLFFFEGNKEDIDKFILSTGFMGIKALRELQFYLYLFINSQSFHQLKDTLVQGAVQEAITNTNIKEVKIIIPPENFILLFNEKVEPFIKQVFKNKKENQTLSSLRDLLLPKLMSGEVRV